MVNDGAKRGSAVPNKVLHSVVPGMRESSHARPAVSESVRGLDSSPPPKPPLSPPPSPSPPAISTGGFRFVNHGIMKFDWYFA